MPSLLDIRRRIRSVKNTQQLTKAMKTVSAAKLRRAQERVVSARPYANQLRHVLSGLAGRLENITHPLLEVRPENRILLLPCSERQRLRASSGVMASEPVETAYQHCANRSQYRTHAPFFFTLVSVIDT